MNSIFSFQFYSLLQCTSTIIFNLLTLLLLVIWFRMEATRTPDAAPQEEEFKSSTGALKRPDAKKPWFMAAKA